MTEREETKCPVCGNNKFKDQQGNTVKLNRHKEKQTNGPHRCTTCKAIT